MGNCSAAKHFRGRIHENLGNFCAFRILANSATALWHASFRSIHRLRFAAFDRLYRSVRSPQAVDRDFVASDMAICYPKCMPAE